MRFATALTTVSFTAALATVEPTAFRVDIVGHGRPMILIPGLSSSGDTWKGAVAHYQDRFTTHTITLAGFAGVPPTSGGPLLASVRDQLADYIERHHLEKPVVVGHSLGGNVALDLASSRPDLVGPVVVVDSLPFYANVMFRVDTAEAAKPMIENMRKTFAAVTREQYDAYVQSHQATKFMVTRTADLDTLTDWGMKSDPETVYRAMIELYQNDLRPSLARIAAPTLVLGTWIGIRDGMQQTQVVITRDAIVDTFKQQYATLPRMHFALSETARHFVVSADVDGSLTVLLRGGPEVKVSRRQSRRLRDELSL